MRFKPNPTLLSPASKASAAFEGTLEPCAAVIQDNPNNNSTTSTTTPTPTTNPRTTTTAALDANHLAFCMCSCRTRRDPSKARGKDATSPAA